MIKKKNPSSRCENCLHFEWDDEADCYVCNVNLDEDDAERYLRFHTDACPYFTFYDEYKAVRKRI